VRLSHTDPTFGESPIYQPLLSREDNGWEDHGWTAEELCLQLAGPVRRGRRELDEAFGEDPWPEGPPDLLKDPGVILRDPGALFKDPGVLEKGPRFLLKTELKPLRVDHGRQPLAPPVIETRSRRATKTGAETFLEIDPFLKFRLSEILLWC